MVSFSALKCLINEISRMKNNEKSVFNQKNSGWFARTPCIPHLIMIGIIYGCYYYINVNGYFPLWITWIYYTAKVLIALEIIVAGAKSLVVPLLALIVGVFSFYLAEVHYVRLITDAETWQLIAVAIVALLITGVVRLLKKSGR